MFVMEINGHKIVVEPKITPEEKARRKKEAKKEYMREYMRQYLPKYRKDDFAYHRGPYVSKYDRLKQEKENAVNN
jgi:hypothetical protein